MTYGDLIVYVIQNNLVNEEVFQNGRLAGFMTVPEAAVKFGVGESTVRAWMNMNMLDYVHFNGLILIPQNAENQMERKKDEKTTTDLNFEFADKCDDKRQPIPVIHERLERRTYII